MFPSAIDLPQPLLVPLSFTLSWGQKECLLGVSSSLDREVKQQMCLLLPSEGPLPLSREPQVQGAQQLVASQGKTLQGGSEDLDPWP